ncbi:hypothetical protein GCM10023238_15770 [Streptomyces heliomycini]
MSNLHPFLIGLVVVAIGLTFAPTPDTRSTPHAISAPGCSRSSRAGDRSPCPDRFGWFSGYWWIPIVGPLIGGVLGALVYDLFIGPVLKARAGAAEEGPATEES